MPIPLEAIGTGNVLVSEELKEDGVNFNHQFVGRPFSKEVSVSCCYQSGVSECCLVVAANRHFPGCKHACKHVECMLTGGHPQHGP